MPLWTGWPATTTPGIATRRFPPAVILCELCVLICQQYTYTHTGVPLRFLIRKRILQQSSLAQHWARDWRALALTQVHHGSRLSDSREDGEALSSVHSTALAAGKLIHNLLCDGRVKND